MQQTEVQTPSHPSDFTICSFINTTSVLGIGVISLLGRNLNLNLS